MAFDHYGPDFSQGRHIHLWDGTIPFARYASGVAG
jgi:hypothetical protein